MNICGNIASQKNKYSSFCRYISCPFQKTGRVVCSGSDHLHVQEYAAGKTKPYFEKEGDTKDIYRCDKELVTAVYWTCQNNFTCHCPQKKDDTEVIKKHAHLPERNKRHAHCMS